MISALSLKQLAESIPALDLGRIDVDRVDAGTLRQKVLEVAVEGVPAAHGHQLLLRAFLTIF